MFTNNEIATLFILSIPIACVSWTVTHEEIFSELKNFCVKCSQESTNVFKKKFFYLFTCEYCFSHYVTALMLIITKYTLLYTDWRGYIIAGFSIVWIANIYMSIYVLIKMDIKKERAEATIKEDALRKDGNNNSV